MTSSPHRKAKDHARYMSEREERLAKQREYYRANRERCILAVRLAEYRREQKQKDARNED